MRDMRLLAWALVLGALLWALGPGLAEASEPEHPIFLELQVGKSTLVTPEAPISRISVADPEVADVLLLSPTQIYLTGTKPGGTNLTIWGDDDKNLAVYEVVVRQNLSLLKAVLFEALPQEKSYRLIPAGDNLTIIGTVSSPESVATITALAEHYGPGNVINLLTVEGVHQVMLDVSVAEMDRNVMERVGIDFTYFNEGSFAYSMLNQLFTLDNEGPLAIYPYLQEYVYETPASFLQDLEQILAINEEYPGTIDTSTLPGLGDGDTWVNPGNVSVSDNTTGMFRFNDGKTTYTGFLDTLKGEGLIKILAEPNLICLSGQESNFLAGGEIPVPVPQGLGTVGIEYKEYGVRLKFKPMVLSGGKINIEVSPEVSELDYSSAITVSGFLIPGLTTRKATTTIELRDGQSFAIAGLIKENVVEDIEKYPVLGDVPVLGSLFRSTAFQKAQSELVIMVTPHLVKPLDAEEQALPTDFFEEPSEFEFHVLGFLESVDKDTMNPAVKALPEPAGEPEDPARSGLDGPFGHMAPLPWEQ